MVSGVWGKKIGMTQVFVDNKVVPVTAINVGNWLITNIRTTDRDGYNAIQVGCVRDRYVEDTFAKSWLSKPKQYFSVLREIRLTEPHEDLSIGQPVNMGAVLTEGDSVDVFGITRGRGFAGCYKRHGFGGAPESHGSTTGRRPGSVGFMRSQGRVIKGKRMAGHMGVQRRMVQGLRVIRMEQNSDLILIKGSVPGHSGSLVFVRKIKA